MVKKFFSKPVRILLSIALSALLLWLSFRGIEWSGFIKTLKGCRWQLVILSAIAGGLMPACRALRWRLFAQPFDSSIGRVESVVANYFAYLVNMGVPYTHEATRCIIIQRSRKGTGPGYDRLVGLAAVERLCDAVCIVVLLAVISVASWQKYGAFLFGGLKSSGMSGVLMTVLFFAVVILLLIIMFFISKSRSKKSGKDSRTYLFFKGIGEGIKSISSLKHPLLFSLDTVLLWFLYWLQFHLAVKAIPGMEAVSPIDSLFGVIAGMLSTIIPAPGGFGAFHYVIASSMAVACNVPWDTGIACATVMHESQAIFLIAAGFISFFFLRGKWSHANGHGCKS